MSNSYFEKFKDPRWQRKRLEILERDNWTCRECRDPDNTLHVHHMVYKKGAEPWDYDDNQLVTLCENCHDTEHGEEKKELLSDIRKFIKENFLYYDTDCVATLMRMLKENEILVKTQRLEFALYDKVFVEFLTEAWKNLADPQQNDIKFIQTADRNILSVGKK